MPTEFATIDEYISSFPAETRVVLSQLSAIIKSVAPDAKETFSYGIPTFKLNGHPLVHFAGYKQHVGFYATPTGHEAFKEELAGFKQGKGSVQFPIQEPLPVELIRRMVIFRRQECLKQQKS